MPERWRGMLRLVPVLVTVISLVALLVGAEAGAEPGSAAVELHVVGEGETLWSIAAAYTAPGEDVRRTVAIIRSANAILSGMIQEGSTITIPTAEIPGQHRITGT